MVSLDALVMLEQIEFYAKKLVNALVFKDAVDQNNFFGLSLHQPIATRLCKCRIYGNMVQNEK